MTKQDLTDQIEAEFGWLSPDEKQKLFIIMKSNWNSAIAHAAQVVSEANNLQQESIRSQSRTGDHQFPQRYQTKQQISTGTTNKQKINNLKL